MSSRPERRRPWRNSIRARLALWYGVILGAVFFFMGFLLYAYLSKNLYSDFDISLRSTAEALSRSSPRASFSFSELDPETFLEGMDDPEFFSKFFHFFDPFGNSGSRSRNLPKQPPPLTPAALNNALKGKLTFETFIGSDRTPIRVLTFPVVRRGQLAHVIQVGGSLRHIEQVLRRLRFILLLTLPTVLLLALAGGWFLTDQALRPVDAMTQVARQITAGDLSRRIQVSRGGSELTHLAETFNTMIERMEESIQRLRQFTANASHELRTPLTILKGETEMALRQARTPEEYQQTLVSGLEEIDRISKIVEDLLLLSKADLEKARLEMRPVQLDALVAETVSQVELLAQEKKISLVPERIDPAIVKGDIYQLRELLLNLIENAIRYTPPEGRIVVSLQRNDEEVRITVSDTGIGIPKEELPKIFDRFYRSDAARAMHPKGSGLGLSICQWIVKVHGGEIDVRSEPGQGTQVTLHFPPFPH
jgi:two-component system OmpR family sensor kinase